jgi:hypothetical protein
MPNTPPPLPIEQRETPDLVEDLCLALRNVGVGDYTLRRDVQGEMLTHIKEVQKIYSELQKRNVHPRDRIILLSNETNWQMHRLLDDCLAYPDVIPFVREIDGIRRALRCPLCLKKEVPDREGIWLCDACLSAAINAIDNKTPVDGLVLLRTYNPSKWCDHADAETVMMVFDNDWIGEGYCKECLLQERSRRDQLSNGATKSNIQASTTVAWIELTDEERGTVWDRFYAEFNFKISVIYKALSRPKALERDLNAKTLGALQRCLRPEQFVYALDWQHTCYYLYPHKFAEANELEAWRVPVLPNGDYYIFLAEDFRFGLFCHPWEQTICVFGKELLDAFTVNMPEIFSKIVRKNGKQIEANNH